MIELFQLFETFLFQHSLFFSSYQNLKMLTLWDSSITMWLSVSWTNMIWFPAGKGFSSVTASNRPLSPTTYFLGTGTACTSALHDTNSNIYRHKCVYSVVYVSKMHISPFWVPHHIHTGWRWLISFMLQLLYSGKRAPDITGLKTGWTQNRC
jgi:hypothetical protein